MVGLEKYHLAPQSTPRFGTMETGGQRPGRARSESHPTVPASLPGSAQPGVKPHLKRLLKFGRIWLCPYRRAWLSGTS